MSGVQYSSKKLTYFTWYTLIYKHILVSKFAMCICCKPRENLWNCSRTYTKMFKIDSFFGNEKLSLNQNVWWDHATMQQDVFLHFRVIFLRWNMKKLLCCPALELFHCLPIWKTVLFVSSRAFSLSTPTKILVVYPCGKQWGYMKKATKCNKIIL